MHRRNRGVALRKESVDRNLIKALWLMLTPGSLSARRAWIEIGSISPEPVSLGGRSPQGERG